MSEFAFHDPDHEYVAELLPTMGLGGDEPKQLGMVGSTWHYWVALSKQSQTSFGKRCMPKILIIGRARPSTQV